MKKGVRAGRDRDSKKYMIGWIASQIRIKENPLVIRILSYS